ncbi:histidine kinase [Actinokineospora sp. NBRC 105648]|uniref:sensor histidine kinase n=1 Tax=Actinokineospora sp. NBRC 105648 TaxID=3032206 RepID=UPI0024A21E7E|nr:histidine kinase [Actinokineospora sp. NBRC 105648]GLZ41952.1 two-component sensor histidine kinase [Actinokineospora sp. NBRC 105648]
MVGARVEAWLARRAPLVDVVTAAALATSSVLFGLIVHAGPDYFLVTLGLSLPLAVRRRRPVGCAVVVGTVAFVQWATLRDTVGAVPANLAVPMAVYAVAVGGSARAARLVLLAGLVGACLGGLSWPRLAQTVSAHVITGAFLGASVLAAWALGALHRVRRGQVDALAERARLLEVEREQRDRLAVLAERNRVAREVHDIVAHSLAVVIAQADGGRYAPDPAAGRAALATIAEHARQALGETRRVLGVLRDGPGDALGIDDIPALVDRVRAGGLDVRLAMRPPPGPVDPGLGLVAYRIVQEGLTNVLKHAGPAASAEVALRWGPGRLEIEVADDGPAPSAPATPGYGVRGMRERAGAYHGTVTLAPRPGGGRVLRARIPVPG